MTDDAGCDVVVFGAGVAGAAAALRASSRNLKAAIVDRGGPRAAVPRLEWLHPEAVEALKEAKIPIAKVIAGTIDRLLLVDQGSTRQMTAAIGRKVSLVDSGALASELLKQAERGGARRVRGEVAGVEWRENAVCLRLEGGAAVVGRVLLGADGYPSLAARSMASDRTIGATHAALCCETHRRLKKGQASRAGKSGEMTLFFESDDLSTFGYACAGAEFEVLGLLAPAGEQDVQTQLGAAIKRWLGADLVSPGWEDGGARMVVRSVPRGAALDAETHVGKHTLVIGDAGGFIGAVNHEGLYGAIRSAFLGADTCADALASAHPQDVLMEYDARWRRELADYLRPPNSDMRFLLPLVFSNKPMAERVARSFVLGTNI